MILNIVNSTIGADQLVNQVTISPDFSVNQGCRKIRLNLHIMVQEFACFNLGRFTLMNLRLCANCTFVKNLVAIGQGARCGAAANTLLNKVGRCPKHDANNNTPLQCAFVKSLNENGYTEKEISEELRIDIRLVGTYIRARKLPSIGKISKPAKKGRLP